MTIGGKMLLDKYGSRLNIAIAWIKGEINLFEEHIIEFVTPTTIAAAKARIELQDKGII